jgi:arginine exporter protein ArgO
VQLTAAAVLVGVAAFGFLSLRRRGDATETAPHGRLYLRFVALTSVNPATVAYFAALIAGLPAVANAPAGAKAVFVVAAGVASLSWQLVLAGAGATLHHRLPTSARVWTAVLGNLLVLALAARMALESA